MSAKILEFDPSRVVRPRYYTPIALRGRLLQMPPAKAEPNFTSTGKHAPSADAADQGAWSETARESGVQVSAGCAP
jgi:hypothetical protein